MDELFMFPFARFAFSGCLLVCETHLYSASIHTRNELRTTNSRINLFTSKRILRVLLLLSPLLCVPAGFVPFAANGMKGK